MTKKVIKLTPELERITEVRKKELCRVYDSVPQIGLFLGAGATKASGVPLYLELALYLCRRALNDNLLKPETPIPVMQFLAEQSKRVEEDYNESTKYLTTLQISPEEIVLFLRTYLSEKSKLVPILKETLYDKIKTMKIRNMVSPVTWKDNVTLNSIISFCARIPPESRHSKKFRKAEVNPKIGGILTTNYDSIVEGSFNGKFRKKLMKPVGRVDSRESIKAKTVIPVYHIHGYVSYANLANVSKMLVIAEDDYFERFYDPLSYSTYIAMYFLRRFPCLFIGSSMKDQNIRRFLYHLQKERSTSRAKKSNYFAILPATGTAQDRFMDALLKSYNVETLWIEEFEEIREILKQLYCYPNKKEFEEWEAVYNY